MTATHSPLQVLNRQTRACVPDLLAEADDPHAEVLTLVWGPKFDREHAIGLWAGWSRREPVQAMPALPELMSLADRFDALAAPLQHRLRRLILRHQALRTLVV